MKNMIQQVIFKDCDKLQDCRFAPCAGETAFIIDNEYVIHNDECYEFDCEFYKEIFEVVNTYP